MLGTIIGADGFDVTTAIDGTVALAIVGNGQALDLFLTDIRMPSPLDGFALAKLLRRRLPTLQVIYISGWVENLPDRGYVLGPLLRKPIRSETLCTAVRQILKITPP
jgi:CheY-like chemotaxis protein